MKIQDYLHFYLGVDYWTDNSEGNLNATTLPNVLDMIKRGKNVQLHLRPLSSMTEEELKQVRSIMLEYAELSFDKQAQDLPMRGGDFFYETYDDEGNHISSVSSHRDNLPAKAVPYLLSRGFDLFGLIPAGLALDATTPG
jgi:hypothetical protein